MSSFSFLNNIQSNGGIESYSNSKLEYFDVSTGGSGAGGGRGGGAGGAGRDAGRGGADAPVPDAPAQA